MDKRKMRYKTEIQQVNSHYYEEVWVNYNILNTNNDLTEVEKTMFQSKFDKAAGIVRTSLPLKNLTVPKPFNIELSALPGVSTAPLSKNEHIANLEIIISDWEDRLQGVKNIFKGTAESTEKKMENEIKGIHWCKEMIQNEAIVL